MKADVVLDVKGLYSPMPVIRTKKAIDAIQSGQILEVISTDPATKSDISALLNRLDHDLLQIKEEGGIAAFYIKKNNAYYIILDIIYKLQYSIFVHSRSVTRAFAS